MSRKIEKDYTYIKSFRQLKEERLRLSYEIRLSRRKLDLSLMELGDIFSPIRLFSTVAKEWIKPVSKSIRYWLEDFFRGHAKNDK